MFTGIIEAVGNIVDIQPQSGDKRFLLATEALDMQDVKLGDSIAVNGVCLTVAELVDRGFWADVSRETLDCSTLNSLRSGAPVNFEKALLASSRLGGHFVSGHVDGIGRLVDRYDDARSVRFEFKAPERLVAYIAEKGSICIDGTSLTVNRVSAQTFAVNIVPHTLDATIVGSYVVGTDVNLEVDLIARYLEQLLKQNVGTVDKNTSDERLKTALSAGGFIN